MRPDFLNKARLPSWRVAGALAGLVGAATVVLLADGGSPNPAPADPPVVVRTATGVAGPASLGAPRLFAPLASLVGTTPPRPPSSPSSSSPAAPAAAALPG